MKAKKRTEKVAFAFLDYLSEKGDIALLSDIVGILTKRVRENKNVALVTTPLILTSEQKKSAARLVTGLIGAGVSIDYRVEPTLIDGLTIRYHDRVWDYSLEHMLTQIT